MTHSRFLFCLSACPLHSNRSWAIECSALYHRSVLECGDKHAQDRALQQLEELSSLFDKLHAPTTVASVAELQHSKLMDEYRREDIIRIRMKDVYLSNYPSIWTLKQGIAATVSRARCSRTKLVRLGRFLTCLLC